MARQRPTTGNPPTVFPSIEAAMASFAKLNNPPRIAQTASAPSMRWCRVDGGYMLKRDPDNGNAQADRRGRADAAPAAHATSGRISPP